VTSEVNEHHLLLLLRRNAASSLRELRELPELSSERLLGR
jgi:hypothetical protein